MVFVIHQLEGVLKIDLGKSVCEMKSFSRLKNEDIKNFILPQVFSSILPVINNYLVFNAAKRKH